MLGLDSYSEFEVAWEPEFELDFDFEVRLHVEKHSGPELVQVVGAGNEIGIEIEIEPAVVTKLMAHTEVIV